MNELDLTKIKEAVEGIKADAKFFDDGKIYNDNLQTLINLASAVLKGELVDTQYLRGECERLEEFEFGGGKFIVKADLMKLVSND